jgi:hypothetical protein
MDHESVRDFSSDNLYYNDAKCNEGVSYSGKTVTTNSCSPFSKSDIRASVRSPPVPESKIDEGDIFTFKQFQRARPQSQPQQSYSQIMMDRWKNSN